MRIDGQAKYYNYYTASRPVGELYTTILTSWSQVRKWINLRFPYQVALLPCSGLVKVLRFAPATLSARGMRGKLTTKINRREAQ